LEATAECRRREPRLFTRHGARRGPLPPLRRPPRPCLRRRPGTDRTALLHERRGARVHREGLIMPMGSRRFVAAVLLLSAAIVAQAAPAPELARPGLQWFNVAAPLPIASLRGRIVILDFWTEGCINCIHIIPILRGIERQFADKVVVI